MRLSLRIWLVARWLEEGRVELEARSELTANTAIAFVDRF